MRKFWLKLWIGIKVTIILILLAYLGAFIYENHKIDIHFWVWPYREIPTTALMLSSLAFLAGIIAALLVRTTWTTVRQVRELQDRNRQEKLHRDMEDIKVKSGMLRPKPVDEPTHPA